MVRRSEFDIKGIVNDAFDDIDQIVLFLSKMDDITPESDNKIVELVKILNSDQMTSNGKVIIFSEFMTTARYIETELKRRMPDRVIVEIDSKTSENRTGIVRRFSPYYNGRTSKSLKEEKKEEIRF